MRQIREVEAIELGELVENLKQVLDITDMKGLADKLQRLALSGDEKQLDAVVSAVCGDLSIDFLQAVYQYYQADRKGNKQDFTPASIARLASALVGKADSVVDLCCGSGALTIQKHNLHDNDSFEMYELDNNVIPYTLFNLVIRNIPAVIYQGDVLHAETIPLYKIEKGEKYGKVVNF